MIVMSVIVMDTALWETARPLAGGLRRPCLRRTQNTASPIPAASATAPPTPPTMGITGEAVVARSTPWSGCFVAGVAVDVDVDAALEMVMLAVDAGMMLLVEVIVMDMGMVGVVAGTVVVLVVVVVVAIVAGVFVDVDAALEVVMLAVDAGMLFLVELVVHGTTHTAVSVA